jgi:hypothetical protein
MEARREQGHAEERITDIESATGRDAVPEALRDFPPALQDVGNGCQRNRFPRAVGLREQERKENHRQPPHHTGCGTGGGQRGPALVAPIRTVEQVAKGGQTIVLGEREQHHRQQQSEQSVQMRSKSSSEKSHRARNTTASSTSSPMLTPTHGKPACQPQKSSAAPSSNGGGFIIAVTPVVLRYARFPRHASVLAHRSSDRDPAVAFPRRAGSRPPAKAIPAT